MEDSDTEFVAADEENEKKKEYLDSANNNQPHAIAYDETDSIGNGTDWEKRHSEEKKTTEKEIYWATSAECVSTQNE